MDERPVGVFDSGLGGLTAVRQLKELLPHENIVYFGDTGRVPYGTRGRETIVKYTRQDIRFLLSFGVKMIVIACGTVSSNAYQEACELSPVPVLGVIRPAAAAAARVTSGSVGVLGTGATVCSGSFQAALREIDPGVRVVGKACPLFVPLVENGYFAPDNPVAALVAREYLEDLRGRVDTLILGCTHYPLLRDTIAGVMGPGVTLIDAGREAALAAGELLRRENLLSGAGRPGSQRYFVSDSTEDFSRLAGIFMNCRVSNVEKVEIEQY